MLPDGVGAARGLRYGVGWRVGCSLGLHKRWPRGSLQYAPPVTRSSLRSDGSQLARAKGVVPAANARADKAQPANDAAAKKAAAGKDKGKQEAKRKEEAKPKEKAKGKGKEGKPAQPADGAAASKGAPPSLRR